MLDERGIDYRYREYRTETLTEEEIRAVLGKLGLAARDVLRKGDARRAGLDGSEDEDTLIACMAEQPTLLQRPIGVRGDRAVLGRPPERLLALMDQG